MIVLLLSAGTVVKIVVKLACDFSADAGRCGEIAGRRALDRLEGSKVRKQRSFASWSHARDFLQTGFADIAPAAHAMRADSIAMRFVAQPLHEIEQRIARLEDEGLAPGQKEGLPASIPVTPLADRGERHVINAERLQRFLPGLE